MNTLHWCQRCRGMVPRPAWSLTPDEVATGDVRYHISFVNMAIKLCLGTTAEVSRQLWEFCTKPTILPEFVSPVRWADEVVITQPYNSQAAEINIALNLSPRYLLNGILP